MSRIEVTFLALTALSCALWVALVVLVYRWWRDSVIYFEDEVADDLECLKVLDDRAAW